MTGVVLIGFLPEDRERLARLTQALQARGLAVDWWSDPPSRSKWINELQGRIEAASGVLAVWTEASARDRWSAVVADEALERRALISVVLDPVVVPPAFREVVPVDLKDWDGEVRGPGIDRLVAALAMRLGLPPGFPAATPRPPPPARAPEAPEPSVPADGTAPVPPVLLHPAAFARQAVRPPAGGAHGEVRRSMPAPLPPAVPVPLRPTQAAAAAGAGARPAVLVPLRRAAGDLDRPWGVLPCGYGWALAWALGLVAMGLYLLPAVRVSEAARVYIGNLELSAAGGAAVGLAGAAFMGYALVRERIGVAPVQVVLIAAAWVLGGAGGLLTAAWCSLPVIGVAEGLVGFDLGWVLCWLIAALIGSLGTWLALRPAHPGLNAPALALIGGGFALGALGGWLIGWLLVAVPILPLYWLLDALLPPGPVRDLVILGLQVLSLGLTGLVGGAAYGLAGGAVLLGSLARAASPPSPF